ncbi:MAG: hypothetical protein KAX57_00955 [Rhodoferax sp.]|jgi:hypothetical protein|uniref:hypothetical protein n=1 Tax=Rhodoferax sp. TaxID=50421 RepID=UPI001B47AE91|nr:hypothetical protein [Rhodoferax sp.]MBP8285387.1 hypothetical protein [Rhodoferax sp.]MBP9148719.1 hypothetical protein [Rhodoferax sp.]MBP9736247.1 hypothetical protein [Rhodoferax sp.]
MSPALIIALAAAVFAAGGATGIKWQIGVQARATLAAQTAREGDAKRQVRAIDTASTTHVATLARLNNQLGTAREQIALLSGRECLDAGTVGLLNAIGHQPMPAAAPEPADQAPATAAGAGIRFATERDTASAIATCRARYAELSSQLDQILDIEDARQ